MKMIFVMAAILIEKNKYYIFSLYIILVFIKFLVYYFKPVVCFLLFFPHLYGSPLF